MLFQSFDFLVFFPLVFALFWAINKWNVLTRNIFLLAASYFFYGYWDYRFLALILSSSLVDFTIGILLHKTTKASARKGLLAFSVIFNIGLLGYCKYLNFFIENFVSALSSVGIEQDISTLQIILPVGISFYTFQTLSYTIDVYRKNIEPERNLVTFLTFVSFFPQLVAGPIERASNLLGQFRRKSEFTYSTGTEALRQILYGLIKKVIIADNCAIYANQAFANHSDIARGVAKLLGFELMKNFNFPYFSKSIGEFWHRWHISLSTWFRDYIYIPLGGSRGSRWKTIRNIFIIFLVSGFWHGANWTFIIWGAVHAILFIPSIFFKKPADKSASGFRYIDIVKMLYTFSLVCLTWIFFRADSMQHALSYLSGIFSIETFQYNGFYFKFLPVLTVFILWEWFNRNSEYGWKLLPKSKVVRWFVYLFLICLILFFRQDDNAFIYFQF